MILLNAEGEVDVFVMSAGEAEMLQTPEMTRFYSEVYKLWFKRFVEIFLKESVLSTSLMKVFSADFVGPETYDFETPMEYCDSPYGTAQVVAYGVRLYMPKSSIEKKDFLATGQRIENLYADAETVASNPRCDRHECFERINLPRFSFIDWYDTRDDGLVSLDLLLDTQDYNNSCKVGYELKPKMTDKKLRDLTVDAFKTIDNDHVQLRPRDTKAAQDIIKHSFLRPRRGPFPKKLCPPAGGARTPRLHCLVCLTRTSLWTHGLFQHKY